MDWSKFERKIYIDAKAEDLYRAWACSSGIESWFLRRSIYSKADGSQRAADELVEVSDGYQWEWHNWEPSESGKILDANGLDHFAFTFAGDCRVDIKIEAGRGMQLLTLTQSNIPLDEESKMGIFFGCSNGWTFFLANLKAYMEHQVNLTDMKPDLMGKHNGMDFVNM